MVVIVHSSNIFGRFKAKCNDSAILEKHWKLKKHVLATYLAFAFRATSALLETHSSRCWKHYSEILVHIDMIVAADFVTVLGR